MELHVKVQHTGFLSSSFLSSALPELVAPPPARYPYMSANKHDFLRRDPSFAAHVTTIDEAHPSDEMYRLIWHEIRNQIYKADCTFDRLSFQITKPPSSN
jgi:hypothetical protein